MGEGDQKAQTSNYKRISTGDVMHSVMTKVNSTVAYIRKLLRE